MSKDHWINLTTYGPGTMTEERVLRFRAKNVRAYADAGNIRNGGSGKGSVRPASTVWIKRVGSFDVKETVSEIEQLLEAPV